MFDFAKTSAPASRSLRTWNASLAGIGRGRHVRRIEIIFDDQGHTVQGAGKTRACEFGVEASAADKALALIMIIALSAGPFLSYAAMRSRYIWTNCRHVTCRASSAARISANVVSCVDNRENKAPSLGITVSRAQSERLPQTEKTGLSP